MSGGWTPEPPAPLNTPSTLALPSPYPLYAQVYSQLAPATLNKIHLSVAGNHAYWVLGDSMLGTTADQYANGHMQYYAQDTRAARDHLVGDNRPPFNFSVDPGKGRILFGGNKPAIDNSFWYNQVRRWA